MRVIPFSLSAGAQSMELIGIWSIMLADRKNGQKRKSGKFTVNEDGEHAVILAISK